jgi:hypothetical protein
VRERETSPELDAVIWFSLHLHSQSASCFVVRLGKLTTDLPSHNIVFLTSSPTRNSLQNNTTTNNTIVNMPSKNGPPIIPELAPFTFGARSRRHHIVLRRAKSGQLELLQAIAELMFVQLEGDDAAKEACQQDLVRNLAFRVSEAIVELETSLGAAAKTEIADDLQELMVEFEEMTVVFSEQLW